MSSQYLKFFFFFPILLFYFHGSTQNRLNPEKLNEDFEFLITELKLQHQGLYEHLSKSQTDSKIDSIRRTLKTPHTKLKFYEKLRYVIGLTNEGHTEIELPKYTIIKLGLSSSFLPLTVKLCDSNLIVTQHYGKKLQKLKKGSKIISINNEKTSQILEKLYPLIPTDGHNETAKHEWVGGINFSLLYRLVNGKEKKLKLNLQDFGSKNTYTLTIPAVRFTQFKNKNAKFRNINFDYSSFHFKPINDSIAYLSIPSFGNDNLDYERFYEEKFKTIDSLKTKHLIIDIQANEGGTEGNENLLFSYLSKKVVQKYKQVTMLPKPYQKNKQQQSYLEDKWFFEDSIAKRGGFTLYSNYYSDLGYQKPKEELIYHGSLYLLTSGRTFSGGAEFASLIKMTNSRVFIGEETGGTFAGNVSGYSEYIELPNSKIKVRIPTVHFQINVAPKVKGRGIMPDYFVPQTWEDYLNGVNTKKEYAIKKITEKGAR